jgi:amino acid transporter
MFITMTWLAACVVPDYTILDPDMGFFDICVIIGGPWLRLTMIITLLTANLICCLATQASVTRIMYSFSRDKIFPKFFGVIHPKYKSPWLAILFCGISTAFLSIFVNIENLLTLVNFGALSAYLFLNFTVFWFFFIRLKWRGLHGIINYLIVPTIGFTILSFIWLGFDRITLTFGLSWLVIGIVWGAIKSKGYKEVPEAYKKAAI